MSCRRGTLNPDTLKQQIDPGVFYTREQHITGSRYPSKALTQAGLCPFHDDHTEGSFFINIKTGGFHCFSCGAKGGDIIDFTQKKYQLTFREALQKLSSEWGLR